VGASPSNLLQGTRPKTLEPRVIKTEAPVIGYHGNPKFSLSQREWGQGVKPSRENGVWGTGHDRHAQQQRTVSHPESVVALTPASSSETSLALCYGDGEHP